MSTLQAIKLASGIFHPSGPEPLQLFVVGVIGAGGTAGEAILWRAS